MLTHLLALRFIDGAGPAGVQPPVVVVPTIDTSAAVSFTTDFGLTTEAQKRAMAAARRRLEAKLRASNRPTAEQRQALERADRLIASYDRSPHATNMGRLAIARALFA